MPESSLVTTCAFSRKRSVTFSCCARSVSALLTFDSEDAGFCHRRFKSQRSIYKMSMEEAASGAAWLLSRTPIPTIRAEFPCFTSKSVRFSPQLPAGSTPILQITQNSGTESAKLRLFRANGATCLILRRENRLFRFPLARDLFRG